MNGCVDRALAFDAQRRRCLSDELVLGRFVWFSRERGRDEGGHNIVLIHDRMICIAIFEPCLASIPGGNMTFKHSCLSVGTVPGSCSRSFTAGSTVCQTCMSRNRMHDGSKLGLRVWLRRRQGDKLALACRSWPDDFPITLDESFFPRFCALLESNLLYMRRWRIQAIRAAAEPLDRKLF